MGFCRQNYVFSTRIQIPIPPVGIERRIHDFQHSFQSERLEYPNSLITANVCVYTSRDQRYAYCFSLFFTAQSNTGHITLFVFCDWLLNSKNVGTIWFYYFRRILTLKFVVSTQQIRFVLHEQRFVAFQSVFSQTLSPVFNIMIVLCTYLLKYSFTEKQKRLFCFLFISGCFIFEFEFVNLRFYCFVKSSI